MKTRAADEVDSPEPHRGAALPIEMLPFPVLRLDDAGCVVDSNGVLERELGLPPDGLRAHPLREHVDAATADVLATLSDSDRDRDTVLHVSFRGTARTFYLARRQGQQWLIGQPAELEEADRAKARFLTTMSHELRTPLNAVLGYAGLLRDGVYGGVTPQQDRAVRAIVRRAKDLQQLIGDVLDLSRLETGRLETRLDDFDPGRVVAEVTRELAPLARERELHLIVRDQMRTPVHLDRFKYEQVVACLVSNAIKFTPRRGEIEIAIAELNDHHFVTRVHDTGIGIAKEERGRIFEMFQQLDSGPTRRYGGTGVGLALAHRTVDLMGGRIDVESEPGEGTTFVITLPIEPGRDAVARAVEEVPDERSSTRPIVLSIDDDPEVIALLRDSLTPAGYRVVGALNGVRGLELARILQPFAIILDVMMPEKDGWQVLRELKADPALRDIPAIVMSIVSERAAGVSLGVTEYLVKPVDREVLLAMLERLRKGLPRGLASAGGGV
ncbi:MAG TPA: ATP-binding protein [Gemmatimonadaceae bacterium]